MTDALVHAEQQMLMARPWMVAAEGSVWEITAEQGNASWDRAIAIAVREPTALQPPPACWFMVGFCAGDILSRMVHPDSVTTARPLLLVRRDEPSRANDPRDQHWIDEAKDTR